MEEYSILVGKSYRTPDDEVRVVKSVDHGEVEYVAGSGSRGPGMIARVSTKGPRWRILPPRSKARFRRPSRERTPFEDRHEVL
jgi:hypothetical protein